MAAASTDGTPRVARISAVGLLLLALSIATGLASAEDVVWHDGRGVVISANNLTKSGISGWGNAGASSVQVILSGNGALEFTTDEATTQKLCGLARQDRNQQFEPIDYAFRLSSGGSVGVVEKGTSKGWFGRIIGCAAEHCASRFHT